ncbi:MAG: hypothetical protein JWO10_1969 [Microbacteriaceae bacterium]|nr:hypothetical protein [Microbacteriaceae bacterium]
MEANFERVLFVHAHPDDETITTGGTIATLVDRGAEVTVLTCTRGELGEIIPADISALEGDGQAVAALRESELSVAMMALGVLDHRFLGDADARRVDLAPRHYTDSGMRWGEHGAEALDTFSSEALCAAPFGEVAADIATVVDDLKPDAVISYAADGGYGHPDHVRAHEAALRAAEVFGVPFFAIADPASASLVIDVSPVLDRKRRALEAHRSQVTVRGDTFTLSSGPARPIAALEGYSPVASGKPDQVAWADQGFGTHVLAYILALVVGLSIGGIATVNHQLSTVASGITVPWGIIVSIAIIAALLVGLRIVFPGRIVTGIAAIGVLVAIAALSLVDSGGTVIVPANAAGYTLTYGPVVIAMVVLAWPAAGTFRRDKIVTTTNPKGIAS